MDLSSQPMHTIIRDAVKTHYQQVLRFGLVGVMATIVHMSCVIILVEQVSMPPLIANIFAYLLALNVSFWGHRHFTFNHRAPIRNTLGRFLLVSGAGFAFNESLFFVFLHWFNHYYPVALMLTLTLTPLLTFVLGKLWVFPHSSPDQH